MKTLRFITLFILLPFLSLHCYAANKTSSKSPTEQERFEMYLDTIDKYLYRDVQIANNALAECQKLIDQNILLGDTTFIDFIVHQIYLKHSMGKPLEAYRIIANNESQIDNLKITSKQKANFNYIKGFTYMEIGDLESAQNTYYDNLTLAEAKKDTAEISMHLFSLGQLYNDENDSEAAIQCFERILKNSEKTKIRPSTIALVHIELSEVYGKLEQYDKVLKTLQKGYQLCIDNNIDVLKSDILIHLGKFHLETNNLQEASNIFEKLSKESESIKDQYIIYDSQTFEAKLRRAQKNHKQALNIYENLLNSTDSTNHENLMDIYKNSHEISQEMNDFSLAYKYLFAFNKIKTKIEKDERKQKTKYLQIKFETEQKAVENEVLKAKIEQNRTENKLLYSWFLLSFLIIVVSVGAFYQKGKYSKELEKEVHNQTIDLREINNSLNKTNDELKEFNRILSHDLKEPLRNIICFSQLALRDVSNKVKVKDYLNFVIKGGQQLEHLIKSINVFQNANFINQDEIKRVKIKDLILENILGIQQNHPNKKINLLFNTEDFILCHSNTLKMILKLLIENAVTFNENETVEITIDYSLKNTQHFMKIKDNGIGIPTEYTDKIFDMFQRLNNREDYSGSGLGLNIAKKMATNIGGEVSLVESIQNEGSTFLLSFPKLSPPLNNFESLDYSTTQKSSMLGL